MRKITVGLLVFPRFQMLDIAAPSDAFAEVKVLGKEVGEYEILTVGTTRGPIQSSSGLTISPDRTIFDPCPHFDTLIVPGGLGVFDILEDTTLTDWLAAQGENCRRIGAICNGVFALGAAGMINGRTVTTHWMDAARLAAMFRKATIEPDRIYVKDGALYTTAGVTAGIDLSLALIEEDFGKKMAVDVAKYLIVYLRRAGGQSQFSPLLDLQVESDTPTAAVQGYILGNLESELTLPSIAGKMQMSARHLSRIFKQECGMTVMNFVNDARIDAARHQLEATDLPLTEIARRCGFGNASTFRRIFGKRLGISPGDYRQRFHSEDMTI
ncbi:transcriptional regulator [Oxalicibacterium flavum]|uniref:Transcriptional regulator n=1 Tax=Oxalicibacterium flavum TaxID=179467 RepID=A0A8J2UKQ6_9BURK|nr:GlxA family transcriptional regulator [Oxalicibacterium flavum]GGC07661.1 transcriptional regulator [Oxalicibacterium flavum]